MYVGLFLLQQKCVELVDDIPCCSLHAESLQDVKRQREIADRIAAMVEDYKTDILN